MTRWILASASPRRRELLRQMGIADFEIIPAANDEESLLEDPGRYVQELAWKKAAEVYHRGMDMPGQERADHSETVCVIGADTIVVCGGIILGKPKDREDAACMIRRLQGRTHEVMTGVSVIVDGAANTFHAVTRVMVAPMDETQIRRYLSTGEADDKAGAYGIQGSFGVHITGIEGDYYNVVGLPIASLYEVLHRQRLL